MAQFSRSLMTTLSPPLKPRLAATTARPLEVLGWHATSSGLAPISSAKLALASFTLASPRRPRRSHEERNSVMAAFTGTDGGLWLAMFM